MEIIERDDLYIAKTYKRNHVAFHYGKGSTLYDFDEKSYIDFTSGIGVNIFGYNDQGYKDAVMKQLNEVQHTSNLYYSSPDSLLAELLCEKTGMKKVFFGNSGAEANEGALKAARKYSFDKYGENRYEVISLNMSFHGRTLATLTLTGQDKFHKYFGPFIDGVKYSDPNMESIKKTVSSKTCAIFIEVIQGEGGVLPLEPAFLHALDAFCKEKDILLVCDEVQSGNGRTGYFYSYMKFGLKPDIVTTAKGLAGGLPIGAVLLGEKCENTFSYGDHGSTFGGNPVSSSAGSYIVSHITNELLDEVKEKENIIRDYLNLPNVSISGMGLMLGVMVEGKKNTDILNKCLEKGLLVLTAGQKVRLLPPLNISKNELMEGLQILKEVILE